MTELPESVVPYLAVHGAVEALQFYAAGFGAAEVSRMVNDDGTIGHAEFTIGAARFFLADEWVKADVLSPVTLGGYSVSLCIEVDDAYALVDRLSGAGARIERPVEAGPMEGTVGGWVVDPYGHRWFISSKARA